MTLSNEDLQAQKPISRAQLYTLAQLLQGCSRCSEGKNGRPREGRCDACVRRIYRWTKAHFFEIVQTWDIAKKSSTA